MRSIFLECCLNESFNFVRALVKFFIFRLVVDDIPVNAFLGEALCCISVVERRLTNKEDIGDDTDSPDVDLVVIFNLSTELWGHVEWASKGQCLLLVWIVSCSKSKVRQFNVDLIGSRIRVVLTEDVLGLQVSMHDVLLMHEVESEEELLDHISGLHFSKLLHLANLFKKVATQDHLHDDIVVLSVLKELKDASDVGMRSLLEHLKLILVQLLVDLVHLQ